MAAVRLAVVGAGTQCTQSLMPGVPFVEEIDVVAICDLQPPLAERNALGVVNLCCQVER